MSTETQIQIDRLESEPAFEAVAETITPQKKKLSLNLTPGLTNVLREFQDKIERLESENAILNSELNAIKKMLMPKKEESITKFYSIAHALEDKEWLDPDELFET